MNFLRVNPSRFVVHRPSIIFGYRSSTTLQRKPIFSRSYGFHTTRGALSTDSMVDSAKFAERICTVDSVKEAHRVLEILRNANTANGRVWACDTEVADIDLSLVGPVGNGKVISFSTYGGPDVDFGFGKSVLWVDTADNIEVLSTFKDFFEDPSVSKVWHNYGFDRHVLYNDGIDCQGFRGDTMHMARLWRTDREKSEGGGGYSLESLSNMLVQDPSLAKIGMKDLFGIARKVSIHAVKCFGVFPCI